MMRRGQRKSLKLNILLALGLFSNIICRAQTIPENKECRNAIELFPNNANDLISSSTLAIAANQSSNSVTLLQCGGTNLNPNTPGVWFEVTGSGGKLRASTCAEETNYTNRITVYEGDSCDEKSCRYSGLDPEPDCPFTNSSYVDWDTFPGTKYYILVHDAYSDESGAFGFQLSEISEPPTNNDCEDARKLEEGVTVLGSTIGATYSSGVKCDRCIFGGPQNPGVWYRIAPTNLKTEVKVTTCGIDNRRFNVSVFYGDVCGEFDCHEATPNLDITCEDGVAFQSVFVAESGEDYYLYIHSSETTGDVDDVGYFGIAFFQSGFEGDSSTSSGGSRFVPLLWSLLAFCISWKATMG